MIYTVELNFSDPVRELEWNEWYETYLQQLVSLPGLNTAQRFRAVRPEAERWAYLAVYSLDSLDVYSSEAYRRIGGGGNASARFRDAIRRRRNVYAGIDRFPEVTHDGRVLFSEDLARIDLKDVLPYPLQAAAERQQAGATELDGQPERRLIAVAGADTIAGQDTRPLAVYAPITRRYG